MRVRLILAFGLVALIPILAITVFARLGVARQVETYMTSGGMVGLDGLVSSLRDYYAANQTWEGADSLLQSMHGNQGRGMGEMMGQRLRLIDADRKVVYDNVVNAIDACKQGGAKKFALAVELTKKIELENI